MNLGKFFGSAAVSAIKEWNPLGPDGVVRRATNKDFRKAFRKYRRGETLTPQEEQVLAEKIVLTTPTGGTIEHTPPTIPLRTATKATLGSAVIAYPGYEIVQAIVAMELPWPWLEDFTNSGAFIWLCATIIPLAIARFTKSPLKKQAL